MIKINLLGVAQPPSSKGPSMGGAPAPIFTMIMVFVAAMIIGFGIVGVLYKIWSSQASQLAAQMNREKLRSAALAAVQAQNLQYQQHLKDLETRINVIQQLQASRVGPVELMSALGTVVNQTSDVYLYTMSVVGSRYQLKGQSSTVDSMANFLSSLKKSGAFNDVRLEQFYEDDQQNRLTYKFTLSCDFVSAAAAAIPPPGSVPASPGRPPSSPGGMMSVPGQVQQTLKRGS
jgi:Tfp pilus assembly protein PilN